MYGTDVYDKVYFRDDYQQQFEALRSRYHERTQSALRGRKTDKSPVPNATTVIHLHELEDGGVRITSGDFVEYFNHRYGGKDRLGACRAALATAAKKAEMSSAAAARERTDAVGGGAAITCRMRNSRAHTVLVNAMFTLLLVFSLLLLGTSGIMLRHSEEALAAAEQEAVQLEVASTEGMLAGTAQGTVRADYLNYSKENTVTAYEVEEDGFFDAILGALTYLW